MPTVIGGRILRWKHHPREVSTTAWIAQQTRHTLVLKRYEIFAVVSNLLGLEEEESSVGRKNPPLEERILRWKKHPFVV